MPRMGPHWSSTGVANTGAGWVKGGVGGQLTGVTQGVVEGVGVLEEVAEEVANDVPLVVGTGEGVSGPEEALGDPLAAPFFEPVPDRVELWDTEGDLEAREDGEPLPVAPPGVREGVAVALEVAL